MALSLASKIPLFFILDILLIVTCERAKEKMYENINGAFCFKRLNGTNEFGCTSSRSGNTGVLHIIKNQEDLSWLLSEAKANPYIVLLPFDLPNFSEVLLQLKDSGKVSGVILTSNRTSYSPDDSCPNRYSGLIDTHCDNKPWNTVGSSLLFVDFGFPIIYIDSDDYPKDIEFLNQCFQKHNAHEMEFQETRSLCAVELTSYMLAAVDSKTCIRRSTMINNLTPMRYCDPLLGLNIHLPLYPRILGSSKVANELEKPRSVILVVTRLDGTSMFDNLVPGAGSPVLGIVTLLSVAHYLSKLIKGVAPQEKNVMFVFYHGETYDYIGSSRMIYDMENNAFPHRFQENVDEQSKLLKLEDVGLVVEIDEIAKGEIYYHSLEPVPDDRNILVSQFIEALKKELSGVGIKISGAYGRLPPSSLQRFIKKDRSINGVVLGSYDSQFNNKFYHSIFDTGKNLNFTYFNKTTPSDDSIQNHLANFSMGLAKALYNTMFDKSDVSTEKNNYNLPSLIDELLYCYLETPSCEIFENVTFRKLSDSKPYSVYVGVLKNSNITTLTGLTLAWLTGTVVPRNRSTCHNNDGDLVRQYFWMAGDNPDGVCVETYMNYSIAQSPAFEIENYDWTSHEYSTWTESVWQEKMSARVFIKPSKKQEIFTLSMGLFVFGISFLMVYFINAKADILFNRQVLENGGC